MRRSEGAGNEWDFVSSSLKDMQVQSDRLEEATKGLLISPESPLLDVQARTEGMLISSLSFLIDDSFDALSWFVCECDYGRDAKEAGRDGDMRLIDTYDQLYWLIKLDSKV